VAAAACFCQVVEVRVGLRVVTCVAVEAVMDSRRSEW
jgi:hypothetical protein